MRLYVGYMHLYAALFFDPVSIFVPSFFLDLVPGQSLRAYIICLYASIGRVYAPICRGLYVSIIYREMSLHIEKDDTHIERI